jgi:hypothetical protein
MVVALERIFDRREQILQSIYPRDLWLELTSEDRGSHGLATRLVELPGYPATTWMADTIHWPSAPSSGLPDSPVLEAWWDPDRNATPDASLTYVRDFLALEELRGRPIDIDGATVTIESVSLEDRTVMIDSERTAERPCLVVRVAHPRNVPVRVRVDVAGMEGSEERFYQEAGKTTLVCWPFTRDQDLATIRRLDFVLLNGFKRGAERRGFHIRLDGMGQPMAGSPTPPIVDTGPIRRGANPGVVPATAPSPGPGDVR